VTFESWCERDHLIAFDFDPDIVGIAAQPFGFEFTSIDGVRRSVGKECAVLDHAGLPVARAAPPLPQPLAWNNPRPPTA
jgi:hypothetical protein